MNLHKIDQLIKKNFFRNFCFRIEASKCFIILILIVALFWQLYFLNISRPSLLLPTSSRKRPTTSRRSNSPVRHQPSPPPSSTASSSRFVQRHSMSPRRSLSPSLTIRSSPSIFGRENDVQVIGEKRNSIKALMRCVCVNFWLEKNIYVWKQKSKIKNRNENK